MLQIVVTLAKPAKFKPKANSNFGSHLSSKNSSEMTGPNQALFGKLNATCGERMTQQLPCWSLERRIVPQAGHPRLPAWPWAGRAAGARAGTGPCPSQQGQMPRAQHITAVAGTRIGKILPVVVSRPCLICLPLQLNLHHIAVPPLPSPSLFWAW